MNRRASMVRTKNATPHSLEKARKDQGSRGNDFSVLFAALNLCGPENLSVALIRIKDDVTGKAYMNKIIEIQVKGTWYVWVL
jgi:hypothetical protein